MRRCGISVAGGAIAPYSMDSRKAGCAGVVALSFAISPRGHEGAETRTEKCISLWSAQGASVAAVDVAPQARHEHTRTRNNKTFGTLVVLLFRVRVKNRSLGG